MVTRRGIPDRHYFFAWSEVTGYRLRPSTAAGAATDAVAKTRERSADDLHPEGPILLGPAHERGEAADHAGTLAGPNRPFAVTVFSTRRSDIESHARPWYSQGGPGDSWPSTLYAARSLAPRRRRKGSSVVSRVCPYAVRAGTTTPTLSAWTTTRSAPRWCPSRLDGPASTLSSPAGPHRAVRSRSYRDQHRHAYIADGSSTSRRVRRVHSGRRPGVATLGTRADHPSRLCREAHGRASTSRLDRDRALDIYGSTRVRGPVRRTPDRRRCSRSARSQGKPSSRAKRQLVWSPRHLAKT